jgi:hypothetical protein
MGLFFFPRVGSEIKSLVQVSILLIVQTKNILPTYLFEYLQYSVPLG